MLLENHNAIESGGYNIANSLRFQSASSQYLTRTPSVAGNRKTFTLSTFLKRGSLTDANQAFWSAGSSGTSYQMIRFNADGTFEFHDYVGGYNFRFTSTQVFRDPAAWYHIVIAIDTTQATSTNRVKIYINNVQVTAFATATYPTLNLDCQVNSNIQHMIGYALGGQGYFDGYQTEINFIDGISLAPSSFGEFDSLTGQWVAKKYTGTYGTNGFYLPFSNGTSTTTLGNDGSGNANHWTLTNFTRSAGANDCWMTDVPSGNSVIGGNFATLNPLHTGRSTLSKGNLTASGTTDLPTIIPDSGNWYFEISGVAKNWTPPAAFPSGAGDYNFGQRAFANTPTSGYKTLCTANLPTAAIKNGNTVFDAKLWSGNGTARSITGYNFSPDFIWIKGRSTATLNMLCDAVRGVNKQLASDATNAEFTYTDQLTAFNSDGFSLGVDTSTGWCNYNDGRTYVGWAWDAGSSTVSNSSGTIASQVRANPTAGVSVVTYTGNGSNATVGHGLGVAPKMVIVKTRTNVVGDWMTWHTSLPSGAYYLKLNATNAQATAATVWNSTIPTSTVFSVGTDQSTNFNASTTYVAYCFAEIAGFSKFGSWATNGSADGPFVYCGFKPKFIMVKRSSSTSDWWTWDIVRTPYNKTNTILYNNLSSAEISNVAWDMDILSNGFKIRSTDPTVNGAGHTMIFMAFAENPFAQSNAA